MLLPLDWVTITQAVSSVSGTNETSLTHGWKHRP